MSDYLPEDILINVLSRLPVKTLLQFRCVSRTWCSLISSPSFITHHLSKATIRNNDLLFFKYQPKKGRLDSYFLFPDKDFPNCLGEKLDFPLETLDLPNKNCYLETHLVGSCSGLFFVCHVHLDDDNDRSPYVHNAALWNPSIRKTVPIPRPTTNFCSHLYSEDYFGFGFDSINHDYKLVRVGYLRILAHEYRSYEIPTLPPIVEVYSMKSGCWRMVDNDLKYFIQERSSSAFLNGACHWTANTKQYGGELNVIVFFNLADEEFGEIIFPECMVRREDMAFSVTVFDGLLSLVALSEGSYEGQYSSIWTMKKHGDVQSWTKLFDIEHTKDWVMGGLVRFKEDGEVIIVGQDELTKSEKGSSRIWGTKVWGSTGTFLDSYTESLVLLNEASSTLTDSSSSNEANGASKEHSSHVADLEKKKKKRRRKKKKKGKKNMKTPEIGDEENRVLDWDGSSSRAVSSNIVTNEGNLTSKEHSSHGADIDNKKKKKKKKKKKGKKNMETPEIGDEDDRVLEPGGILQLMK